MKDLETFCFNCMHALRLHSRICDYCGADTKTVKNADYQLSVGSILAGRYLIGKALGQGGFGITYIGLDLLLQRRIAIKELFPSNIVFRDAVSGTHVLVYEKQKGIFKKYNESFIQEARVLARFSEEPGIVNVQDFLEENGTSYFVMEYVEGKSLRDVLKKHGPMSTSAVLKLLRPVMHSLMGIHETGILHRDISPDNIMVRPDGTAVLIDFGAARQASTRGEESVSIILKHGYAPMEQYSAHGKQGPWTDVYALCATIYTLITDTTPPQALDRDNHTKFLESPRKLGANISIEQQKALLKGLSVHAEDRQQSMGQLKRELQAASEPTTSPLNALFKNKDCPEKIEEGNKRGKKSKRSINATDTYAVALVICILGGILIITNGKNINRGQRQQLQASLPQQTEQSTFMTSESPEEKPIVTSIPTEAPSATPTPSKEPEPTSTMEPTSVPTMEPIPYTNGVVTASEVILRSGPGQDYRELSRLYKGDRLRIFSLDSLFYSVEVIDTGERGYCHYKMIKPSSDLFGSTPSVRSAAKKTTPVPGAKTLAPSAGTTAAPSTTLGTNAVDFSRGSLQTCGVNSYSVRFTVTNTGNTVLGTANIAVSAFQRDGTSIQKTNSQLAISGLNPGASRDFTLYIDTPAEIVRVRVSVTSLVAYGDKTKTSDCQTFLDISG